MVFLRTENRNGRNVSIVVSKARVVPIKFVTIPRLELQGAVAGFRLAKSTCEELNLSLEDVTYWTDSTTVLKWIRSKNRRFKTFVSNQVD